MPSEFNQSKEFVIVSNNCWGAEFYKANNIRYNTPFVGLYINGPDYIKLLKEFDFFLDLELSFTNISKWTNQSHDYPIGILGGIEIHFVHYTDREDVRSKWRRRLARMKKAQDNSNYYFKLCDRDHTSLDLIYQFHQLPFENKMSFGIADVENENHILITENENRKSVPDGVRLFNISQRYVDVKRWIETGEMVRIPTQ